MSAAPGGRGGAKGGSPKRGGAKGGAKGAARGGAPVGRGKGASAGRGGPAAGRSAAPARAAGAGRARPGGRPPANRRPQGPLDARPAQKERGLGGTQVEGRQAVRELLLAGERRTFEILLSNEVEQVDIVADIIGLADELRVPITYVSRTKLDAVSHTDAPQGIVARAAELKDTLLDDLFVTTEDRAPFLLAVDGVTDPGNLGALLRIAECAGVTGVVLPKHRAVHVTPTVTKTAAGAIEYLSMALVGGLPTAIESMKAAGIWTVGLDMAGETAVHDLEVAASGVCLVLGAEGKGLSRLVRQRCDLIASIPLHGRLDSLNVASAGAVACYEIARLRDLAPEA
jgi:23S rRNA (guanosine2251-2'-O)-methyltransferase